MLEESRRHLHEAGESYIEHLLFAATVGAVALGAGIACLIHALIPGLCQRTCSRSLAELQRLFADRSRLTGVRSELSGLLHFVILFAIALATAGFLIALGGITLIGAAVAGIALAFPAAYLLASPQLDGVDR